MNAHEPPQATETITEGEPGHLRAALRRLALVSILDGEKLRAEIAQALHDEFGQALAVLNFHLFWLSRHCPGDDDVRGKISEMQQALSAAGAGLELISRGCRPLHPPAGVALTDILHCQIRQFASRYHIACDALIPADLPALPSEYTVALLRILVRSLDALAAGGIPDRLGIAFACRDGWITIDIDVTDGRIRESSADTPVLAAALAVSAWIEALGGSCVAAHGAVQIALPLPSEPVLGH